MKDTEKIYIIKINSCGNTLTYSNCKLLPEADITFIRFTDKFNHEFCYNKSTIVSMEVMQ
jgi:hypothetical protein